MPIPWRTFSTNGTFSGIGFSTKPVSIIVATTLNTWLKLVVLSIRLSFWTTLRSHPCSTQLTRYASSFYTI
ncbi:unnamed protein product [Schistocephalus solidus]|uniref:Uncharacterized protein n=1 Tax=Schistocephalus solidus TaxID=70667 RepID=A0A183SCL8_SCHSO|nr:unnamed protein product [Schistocephalus solidus]